MKTENFSKTKIKICGLRRREDILAVNEANPDYCGFIVEFPKSFRSVTADEVRELVKNLSPEIQPVGVFVNASMELVRSLLDDGTLAMAQLHGQEKESYIAELKAHTDKPVIKAFSIKQPMIWRIHCRVRQIISCLIRAAVEPARHLTGL